MIRNHRKHVFLVFLVFIIANSLVISSLQENGIHKVNVDRSTSINSSYGVQNDQLLDQNYLIFVNDRIEYETIKQLFNVLVEYPNLLALELSTSYREFKYLTNLTSNPLIPSHLLREQFISISQSSPINHGVELNTEDEADHLKVSDLWDLGYNGTDVVVAVFDNGIDFTHPDLVGQNYSAPVLFNEIPGQLPVTPCKDHGTPVAGLIAGTETGYLGTAFGSKLVSMEMGCVDEDLSGDPIAGFDWLAGQNETINIVNLSWGRENSLGFELIINRLARLGIITVASAGNDGNNEFTLHDPGSAISSISVGAVDDANNPQFFSSLGPNPNFLTKPDVVAPGSGLLTTKNGGNYLSFTGTSGSAPLVSGAIATLISGLNANGIVWNVGTIKAALMRTATTINGAELKVGQGLVNINATWEYLMNAASDERGPQVLELTPSTGPHNPLSVLPSEITIDIPLTLISSHPDLVNIKISGNLSNVLTYDGETNTDFSQEIPLHANTIGLSTGIYVGIVNASLGDDFVISEITIRVTNDYGGKVLVDLRHTNWDTYGFDYYSGSNTGEMVKLGLNQNLWIQDSHDLITEALLNKFDILWMPDPLDLWVDGTENPAPLLQSEIDVITNFVISGGSLFIDFLGTLEDSYGVFQTNSTAVNLLIQQYGITARSTPVTDLTEKTIIPDKDSKLIGNVTSITHFGNYLDVENSWQSVAEDATGTVIATYENPAGGRVLVSSTNFWLDNTGALGLYTSNGGLGDRELSINTWKWLYSNETNAVVSTTTSISSTSSSSTTAPSSSTTATTTAATSTTSSSNTSDSVVGDLIIMVSIIIVFGSYKIRRRIK